MTSQRFTTSAGWVAAVLERARPLGPVPRFGSPEHLALAPSDARFVAAAAVAAQCWADQTDPARVRSRLRIELASADGDAHRDAQEVVAIARRRPVRSRVTADQFPGPAA